MEVDLIDKDYLLLQINDSLFPIGAYSHSYGLETYIQKNLVHDGASAKDYIEKRLKYSLLYTDMLVVKLAYEMSKTDDQKGLLMLDEKIRAMRLPKEIREATEKLGNRMEKTLKSMGIVYEELSGKSYAIVYGIVVEKAGVELESALKNYIYAQTSAMVTNCVKAVPLSQIEGQRILIELYPVFSQLIARVKELGVDMLGASTPGFDIRCMQHEELYSRLYMS